MRLARTTSLLIAAILVFAAGRASAQPPADAREKARLLHEAGLAEYQAGRYSQAVAAFRHAYKLVPAPGILFNLAQAYRLKGDCRSARRSYKKFLKVSNDPAQTTLAREHLALLEKCAGDQPATPPPTTAPVQPAAPPPTAAPAPAPTPAPAPAPAPAVREPVAQPAPVIAAPAAAPVTAAAPAADLTTNTVFVERHPGRGKRVAGLGLGSAGAAFLVISVYYGLKARSDANELDSFYDDGGGPWTPELSDREDSLDRNRTRALGFGLVGAVALAGGGIFYWMGTQDEKRAQQIGVAPTSSGGAVMSWSGRF